MIKYFNCRNFRHTLVVMSIEAFEQREETLKLKAKLANAEHSRLYGEQSYSMEESKEHLEAIYGRGNN